MTELGNKLTKQKVCDYLRKTNLFWEKYGDGWFFTKPDWMQDWQKYTSTIFEVRTKYLVLPKMFELDKDSSVRTHYDCNNQITYNALPEKTLYELLDYYIEEYKKAIEPAPLMYKNYIEKQKLDKMQKDF